MEQLRRFDVKLLAEKVEDHEEFEFCKKLGFDYFQGYFFCKPHIVLGRQVPVNRISAVRLVAKLQDPAISGAEAEQAVGQDLAVSYRLLRYVNSSGNAVARQIESIRHAVALVGTRRICNWASLMLFANIDDKPRELMVTAMVRARMCEEIGRALNHRNVDQFFTVALFSVLDALLDLPMLKALESLPLAVDVRSALTENKGAMGAAYAASWPTNKVISKTSTARSSV